MRQRRRLGREFDGIFVAAAEEVSRDELVERIGADPPRGRRVLTGDQVAAEEAVAHSRSLLLPRFVVATTTALVALVVGTAVAWALTGSLLGALPIGAMVIGTVLGAVYLVVVVAVVAVVAALVTIAVRRSEHREL